MQQNRHMEQVAASMTYFSFSLEEFARDILSLVDVLNELKQYQSSPHSREWWWLAIWSRKGFRHNDYLLTTEQSRRPSTYTIPVEHKETPPKPTTRRGALNHRIWKALEKLRTTEIKFAVKVGVGAILLAAPAFIQPYRAIYTRWRGEWALLSYFVIIANSVGDTTSIGLWR